MIVSVSCGNWHTLLLSKNGHVFGAGHNKSGAVGIKNQEIVANFTPIPKLNNIIKIAAGDRFSLFVNGNGVMFSCGHMKRNGLNSK